MSWFTFLILIVLPGAWLSFGLRLNEVTWKARLALGIALSPLVVGLEVCLLKLVGVSFGHAVFVVVATALPSIFLILRSLNHEHSTKNWPVAICGVLLFLLLVVCMLFPSLYEPKYRTYSRHALLHTDVCYAISTDRLRPEEPNLAGLPLAYPWFSHIHWAVIGYACDWSPTFMWILMNVAFLAGTCVLVYETTLLLGVHPSTGILGVGLLALGTNLIGKVGSLAKSGFLDWGLIFRMSIRGDPRYTPFLIKYVEFTAMPVGLSIFCALTFVAVLLCRWRSASLLWLYPLLLTSIGLIYPPILPPAVGLSGCLLLLAFVPDTQGGTRFRPREVLVLALGTLLAGFIGYAYYKSLSAGHTRSVAEIASVSGMLRRAAYAGMVFAPLAIPACWLAWQALRKRHGPTLLLLAATLAAVGMNIALRLENGIEYKFVLCAAICLAPLTAAGLHPLVVRRPKCRWALAVIVPMLLAPFMISTSVAYIPWELDDASGIDESSFRISLDPSEDHASWTRAVRDSTPTDTVLVVHKPAYVYSAYTSRSLYVLGSPDSVVGYGLPIEENLLDIRGYSADIYEKRLRLVERLYTECDPKVLSSSLVELKKLERPIALHFSDEDGSELLKFMRQERIGSELTSGGNHVVWYVEPEAL
jgi:hypothetical protein